MGIARGFRDACSFRRAGADTAIHRCLADIRTGIGKRFALVCYEDTLRGRVKPSRERCALVFCFPPWFSDGFVISYLVLLRG
ncbi:hypothetical protein VTH06DRAFT_5295 [Thermothelomyces fergusii]